MINCSKYISRWQQKKWPWGFRAFPYIITVQRPRFQCCRTGTTNGPHSKSVSRARLPSGVSRWVQCWPCFFLGSPCPRFVSAFWLIWSKSPGQGCFKTPSSLWCLKGGWACWASWCWASWGFDWWDQRELGRLCAGATIPVSETMRQVLRWPMIWEDMGRPNLCEIARIFAKRDHNSETTGM